MLISAEAHCTLLLLPYDTSVMLLSKRRYQHTLLSRVITSRKPRGEKFPRKTSNNTTFQMFNLLLTVKHCTILYNTVQ